MLAADAAPLPLCMKPLCSGHSWDQIPKSGFFIVQGELAFFLKLGLLICKVSLSKSKFALWELFYYRIACLGLLVIQKLWYVTTGFMLGLEFSWDITHEHAWTITLHTNNTHKWNELYLRYIYSFIINYHLGNITQSHVVLFFKNLFIVLSPRNVSSWCSVSSWCNVLGKSASEQATWVRVCNSNRSP